MMIMMNTYSYCQIRAHHWSHEHALNHDKKRIISKARVGISSMLYVQKYILKSLG